MKGQSLVEVLVALSVAAAILSAIAVAVVSSLRNTQYSKNQNLASQYASQGMEIIRQIRDTNTSLSSCSNINYCLDYDLRQPPLSACPVYQKLVNRPALGCGQNVGTADLGPTPSSIYIYSRGVTIEPPVNSGCGNSYKVTVTVAWWDNACGDTSKFCHNVNLVSCLSDRATVQTP